MYNTKYTIMYKIVFSQFSQKYNYLISIFFFEDFLTTAVKLFCSVIKVLGSVDIGPPTTHRNFPVPRLFVPTQRPIRGLRQV